VSGSITLPVFQVPFAGVPETFGISLNGTSYTLTVHWCVPMSAWVLDIADATGANPIVSGIPLITGDDLLEQYAYLGIAGQLIVQTSNDPLVPPTFTDLGTTGNLYFLPTP
jgi:hypothetical protein